MAKKVKVYKEKVESIRNILHDYETRNEEKEPKDYGEQISEDTIYARLKKARFKYNLNSCEESIFSIIAASLIFILIAIVYSKFFEISSYVQIALFSIPAIFAIFIIINAFRNFKDQNEIVKIIDRKMGLKERLVTSLEYAELGKKSRLYNTLVSDAANSLDDKSINKALNRNISKRTKTLIILAVILGLASIFLPPQIYDQKPLDPTMYASLNVPVISPNPTPKTEVAKQEKEEEPSEIPENREEKENIEEKTEDKDNKPKVSQSEEQKIEKDINDIIKRILSLLNNYTGSDDLKMDGEGEDKSLNKLSAQADQNREQRGTGNQVSSGSESGPETNDTGTSKDDAKQGQETRNDLLAQNQQNNKSDQSGNKGINPPPGFSGSSQNNTKGSGTDAKGEGSSQTAANTQGGTNRENQKNGGRDREKAETGSAGGGSVASAGNSSIDRTSKSGQAGMDKIGDKGDQSDQNKKDLNKKSGETAGTEDKSQVATGEKKAGKESETRSNTAKGQDQNQSQSGRSQTSMSKDDSVSDSNKGTNDSDRNNSGKDDKKRRDGLGGSDSVAKLDKDSKSGDKSGKDNAGKDGKGADGSLQNVNANTTSTKEVAKSKEGDKNKGQTGKSENSQSGSNKTDGKDQKEGPSGQKVAQQNADTTQKDSSAGKSGLSSDNQKGKTEVSKDTRNINQNMSGAKVPSLGKMKGNQTASKGKSGENASSGETGKGDSAGTETSQGGKQEGQSGNGKDFEGQNKNVTKRDNLPKSSKSDKNDDIDSIKKDIANLLNSVENKIEDYDKKEKSQLGEGKQDIVVSENPSQSDSKEADNGNKISANSQESSNAEDQKSDDGVGSDDGQPGAGIGNESANKLYSNEGENIDFTKGKEFEMFVDGEQDIDGKQKREVESYSTKLESGEWAVPSVPVDENASINTNQSEDDAIKNTKIPGEYEKIIKDLFINDE